METGTPSESMGDAGGCRGGNAAVMLVCVAGSVDACDSIVRMRQAMEPVMKKILQKTCWIDDNLGIHPPPWRVLLHGGGEDDGWEPIRHGDEGTSEAWECTTQTKTRRGRHLEAVAREAGHADLKGV